MVAGFFPFESENRNEGATGRLFANPDNDKWDSGILTLMKKVNKINGGAHQGW